jgi:hypothetical protein
MTPKEFQTTYSGDLKKLWDSPLGKALLAVMLNLKPTYEFPIHEHLMLANREAIRGYDMAMRNLVVLSMAPKTATTPEANYGVKDLPKSNE